MPRERTPNQPQGQYDVASASRNQPVFPIYIGEVMSVEDVQVLQRVWVYIPELGGLQKDADIIKRKEDRRNWILAQIGSPLLAATNRADTKKGDVYDNTQKSYGIFLPIPDINVTVIVAFPGGSIDQATIIGTIGPENRTFTLPGIPWTDPPPPPSITNPSRIMGKMHPGGIRRIFPGSRPLPCGQCMGRHACKPSLETGYPSSLDRVRPRLSPFPDNPRFGRSALVGTELRSYRCRWIFAGHVGYRNPR